MEEPRRRRPPHAGQALTRADVIRLKRQHGRRDGLDLRRADLHQTDLSRLKLSGARLSAANLRGADLHHANLEGARLQNADLQGADLRRANLQGANLLRADLQGSHLRDVNLLGASLHDANLQRTDLRDAKLQGAHLVGAKLQGADLTFANLGGARLSLADLQGAYLWHANLQGAGLWHASLQRARLWHANLRDANLEDVRWGDYVLGEEIDGYFDDAASAYRALKQRHTEAGMYDIAGEFHYREMEARRKLAWKERRLPYASAMYFLRFLYGYGERPERVIGWVVAVILGLALVHWAFGTVERGFLEALYYSAVSFTALGYGSWAPEPQGWAGKFLGVGESLLGVFMMALFLVTFTRKMTR